MVDIILVTARNFRKMLLVCGIDDTKCLFTMCINILTVDKSLMSNLHRADNRVNLGLLHGSCLLKYGGLEGRMEFLQICYK